MKFEIKNRFTGEVQFTADIKCAENELHSVKLGLALLRALCGLLGHFPGDKIHPVFTNMGPCRWHDEHGYGIGYHMRLCKGCGKRLPVTPEDAAEKARINGEVAAIMNGSRAKYGLPPISWDD